MAAARRRKSEPSFMGQPLSPDYLPSLFRSGAQNLWYRNYRINTARGLRTKTMTVQLRASWKQRHPEAAEWVVKVLPERRTLERDLIASVGSVEPTYSRVATGFLDRDRDHANEFENYMEEWRQSFVPTQTFMEKGTEDGEFGVAVYPSDADLDGCPDFYARLDQAAYDALDDDDEWRAEYEQDEDDPKGRYVRRNPDGSKKADPKYDRDKNGKPRSKDQQDFERDDDKSAEAHDEAVQRYLLKCEEGGVSVRVIPANDCVPFMMRGRGAERWVPYAIVERTLLYPEELLQKGYGWRGMGDRLLIPQGFDATRQTGQNGMFYLYALHVVWQDPSDPKKIKRPIIAYSVAGAPTWLDGEPDDDQQLPDCGVAVLDLYESHGLQGRFFGYFGGLHTSDDSFDFYYEPYLWPMAEAITTIEGLQTMRNATVAVQGSMGYFHKPDAALVGADGIDDEALVEAGTQELKKPVLPDAGEIETVVGEVFPATPQQLSPDVTRSIEFEITNLREVTALEQPGAGSQDSGHKLVVKETLAQMAKRQIREGVRDAVKFCGERGAMIFDACEKEFSVQWPLPTEKERAVGSEFRTATDPIRWDSAWVGDGEYRLKTDYPAEYNPVKIETAASMAERGFAGNEDVWDAMGVTDYEAQRAKILKRNITSNPAYIEAQITRLAKAQGNKVMLQVLRLQSQNKMSQTGLPGLEMGVPTAALTGPEDAGGGGISGGPTTAQRSMGGSMAAQTGPAMQDAAAAATVQGSAA